MAVPHLFIAGSGCYEQVGFAADAGVHAPADGVISPALVEVVDDVGVSMADSGHALVHSRPESVVHDGDLHLPVLQVAVVMAEEHHLVVILEPVVGDGDPAGAARHVQKPIVAAVERIVIDPDFGRAHQPYGVAIGASHLHDLSSWTDYRPRASRLQAVETQAVDDDVAHLVEQEAGAVGYVDVGAAAVDGGEALDEQRPLELDDHVRSEGDPDLPLHEAGPVPQRAGLGIHRVVSGVGDPVESHVLSGVAPHLPGESHRAGGEPLPAPRPVAVPSPALVDGVHAAGSPDRPRGEHP